MALTLTCTCGGQNTRLGSGDEVVLEGLVVGDGVGVLDVPDGVEHELDAVLAVLSAGRAAEWVLFVRHM